MKPVLTCSNGELLQMGLKAARYCTDFPRSRATHLDASKACSGCPENSPRMAGLKPFGSLSFASPRIITTRPQCCLGKFIQCRIINEFFSNWNYFLRLSDVVKVGDPEERKRLKYLITSLHSNRMGPELISNGR